LIFGIARAPASEPLGWETPTKKAARQASQLVSGFEVNDKCNKATTIYHKWVGFSNPGDPLDFLQVIVAIDVSFQGRFRSESIPAEISPFCDFRVTIPP
jgi:hypothetical protein